MLRTLTILLLWAYVCSVTELHQLVKLPALFGHFQEHTQADSDETFLCFLADHYVGGAHQHADPKHDQELPFHCHHDCTPHAVQIAIPLSGTVLAISSSAISEPPVLDDSSYCFLLSKDVWQPPKA